jgi:hypothetical protein
MATTSCFVSSLNLDWNKELRKKKDKKYWSYSDKISGNINLMILETGIVSQA